MKRLFTLVVLLSAMAVATQAQGIKFGVKGGFDIQKMEFDASVLDTENKLGWFIGPTLQVGLPIGGLGVDIAAFYDQKSTKVNGESVKQKYVLVPINARLKLGLSNTAGLYVAAGPQFAFNVGDTDFDVLKTSTYENTFQLKKSAFSVNLGAGVYLSDHLEVGFVYNIGVSSTAEASWKSATDAAFHEDSTKPKSWQISATYFF